MKMQRYSSKKRNKKMHRYSDLPEEITFNILSRLPVMSIGLCRCVSKSWRALLSTPDFIRTHLEVSRNIREESLLLLNEYSSVRSHLWYASLSDARHLFDEIIVSAKRLKFPGLSNSWLQIHASCDGLLLLEHCENGMFVLNPIIREIRKVPVSPFADVFRECIPVYGFGYESVTNDYKIVTIYYGDNDEDNSDCTDEMFVDVFSLRTDTWKKAGSSLCCHPACDFDDGIYLNGYIHWWIFRESDDKATIVAFDLVQEKFHEVWVSKEKLSFGDFPISSTLVVLGGRLCWSNLNSPDIWVMKEYGVEQSWTKFTINYLDQLNRVNPLCMLGKDKIVLMDTDKLFAYNWKEEELKDIVVEGIIRPELLFEASFVESLVSPHCTNKTGKK